ncbi:hypothetical protein O5623_28715 [Escherichia coli]|nr:hypothetical protein [Escherichia coli]
MLTPTSECPRTADRSWRTVNRGRGSGIEAAGQVVTLSNGGNNYTGDTLVRSGTLQMANDNVLGATGNLNVASNAVFENKRIQPDCRCTADRNGIAHSSDSGSVLTVSGTQRQPGDDNGGVIENNVLSGEGTLAVTGSDLTVHGTNIGFTVMPALPGRWLK